MISLFYGFEKAILGIILGFFYGIEQASFQYHIKKVSYDKRS